MSINTNHYISMQGSAYEYMPEKISFADVRAAIRNNQIKAEHEEVYKFAFEQKNESLFYELIQKKGIQEAETYLTSNQTYAITSVPAFGNIPTLNHGSIILPDPFNSKGIDDEVSFSKSKYHKGKPRSPELKTHCYGRQRHLEWGSMTQNALSRDSNPEIRKTTGLVVERMMKFYVESGGGLANSTGGMIRYRPTTNCFSLVNMILLKVGENPTTKVPVTQLKINQSPNESHGAVGKKIGQIHAQFRKNVNDAVACPAKSLGSRYHIKQMSNTPKQEKGMIEKITNWLQPKNHGYTNKKLNENLLNLKRA